jgi:hypothetical protein
MKKPKTKAEMIKYLKEHPRYHVMNSWNHSTSYANYVKIRNISNGLPRDVVDRMYDCLEIDEAYQEARMLFEAFATRHHHEWQIGQNGRSGGYLVLLQGGIRDGRSYVCGVNTDMDAHYDTWDMASLRYRVDIVWDFDQTCKQAVDAFIEFARTHKVVNDTIMVRRTIRKAVPLEDPA